MCDSRVVKTIRSLRRLKEEATDENVPQEPTLSCSARALILNHPDSLAVLQSCPLPPEAFYACVQPDAVLCEALRSPAELPAPLKKRLAERVADEQSKCAIAQAKAGVAARIEERMRSLQLRLTS